MHNRNIPRYVYIEGQGNERLVRDTFSMGVVNTNTTAYQQAKRNQAEALIKATQRSQESISVQTMQKDISDLQADMSEMKGMLHQILSALKQEN